MFEKQNIQETVNELKSDAVKGLTDGEAFVVYSKMAEMK